MWIECIFITTGVFGKFFGSGRIFLEGCSRGKYISGDQLRDYDSDDEDLAKFREEQVFALFYEEMV